MEEERVLFHCFLFFYFILWNDTIKGGHMLLFGVDVNGCLPPMVVHL